TNLLLQAQSTAFCPWVRGGWRQYHHFETALGKADSFVCEEVADGFVKLEYSSKLYDKDGKTLPSASVKHTVLFHPDGAASHTVKVKLTKDMDLGHIRIGTLGVRDDMDRVAVRPCSQASWAVELQNPCQWIDLVHGKSRSDLPAYRSRYLPLSVTFVKNGLEALEMSMGDDLGAWDNLGNSFPGLAQGSVCEARDPWRYEAVFAPLDSPAPGTSSKRERTHSPTVWRCPLSRRTSCRWIWRADFSAATNPLKNAGPPLPISKHARRTKSACCVCTTTATSLPTASSGAMRIIPRTRQMR
ncbi:MAG: hypothetical protein IKM17_06855, partial [Lentisphaeria bacterium]|nr:hypothetical protein [Lentisphaeria bacterium]